MKTADNLVIKAAIAWWEGKRPCEFTLEEHLENPTVNAGETDRSHALASAVGAMLKKRAKRPPIYKDDGMSLGARLDRDGWYIAWSDESGEEGLRIGQEDAIDVKSDTDSQVIHGVLSAVTSDDRVERGRDGTWHFKTEGLVREVLRRMNRALSMKGLELPPWAWQALEAGWLPPEGWKPE
jgi:hypothetical protein